MKIGDIERFADFYKNVTREQIQQEIAAMRDWHTGKVPGTCGYQHQWMPVRVRGGVVVWDCPCGARMVSVVRRSN